MNGRAKVFKRGTNTLACAPAVAVALALFLPSAIAASAATSPMMRTVAGTGIAGVIDGHRAAFLMPTGVAVGSHEEIYVADTAAQRIRVIARDGRVSTLAGGGEVEANSTWVVGGFVDARGSSARFNAPMGLAIAADGRIFVADSLNHCIRVVTRDGSVSTYSGRPGQSGKTDGPAPIAKFERPMGVAIDKSGILYVADYGVGVRRVELSGQVTTTSMPALDATGIAISPGGRGTVVAAADSGIYFANPESMTWNRIANDESRSKSETLRPASFYDVGHPMAIVALNDDDVVYSDIRTGALRYLNLYLGTLRVLTGNAGSDVANDQAGYRDGPLSVAMTDEPLGIALDRNSIVIADTGNRRIRRLTGLNLRGPVMPEKQLVVVSAPPKTYRIAYVGNSFVWHNTMWSDSIEGRLEERLNGDRVLVAGKSVYVTPYRIINDVGAEAEFDYINNVLANGLADAVVVQLNFYTFFRPSASVDWEAFERELRQTAVNLKSAGIPFLVVIHPVGAEQTQNEYIQAFIQGLGPLPPRSPFLARILTALNAAGVEHVDLWPTFIAEEQSAGHRPIFGTFDGHFTEYGRALVAESVARALERLRPWAQ